MDGKDIVITRVFDAPVEKVFEAWSNPEIFMKWWGPNSMISPECKMDFRVGGKSLYCMSSPDGRRKMYSTAKYLEIIPNKKIVYEDNFSNENGEFVAAKDLGMPEGYPDTYKVTVTFEEQDGKTKMTLIHSGMPEGQGRDYGEMGWEEAFEKMAAAI